MIRSKKDQRIGFAIVIPGFILLGIFVYGFIGWTLAVSFSGWEGILPNWDFMGLKNFIGLFHSERFRIDLLNTFFFSILFLGFCVVLGFTLAMLLDKITGGEAIFRNIFLFPLAISFVVTGVVWRWIFNPTVGINALIKNLFGINIAWGWFTETKSFLGFNYALIPVVIAAGWQLTGYVMAMVLAGIRAIPIEVIESASIDGAGEFRKMTDIIIPIIKPVLFASLIILGHISLKIFDLVYTMTGSGTAFVTDFPSMYMFETTFQGHFYAEGSGISIIMLLLVAIVIVPYLYSVLKKEKA
jgi:glucose/mannose transport system permease protein